MNILVWTCHAILILSCAFARPNHEENPIHGHRQNHKKHEEKISKSREAIRKKEREIYLAEVKAIKPDYRKFKDNLRTSEQVARRHLNPNSCRREYVNSKNYTRKSLLPEYLICNSMFKNYGENVEKEAIESLERRFARDKKAREEKERGITTIHPLFRTRRTMKPTTTENSNEIFTASSRILHEMDAERRRLYTGDSAHYDKLYYEAYKDVPTEESKSIESDYSSFERWYHDYQTLPQNATTEHYPWWTYNPNETCEHKYNGVPLDYDRALYSLKMSSRLPPNISAEIDAHYNQKSMIDLDYARACEKSMEEWGRTVNQEYNSDAGPVPIRRELRKPFEIIQNRYYDLEHKFGVNFEKDVKEKFIKPAKKGLYRFKHWMNPNYTTTTRRIAMTWPEQDLNSQEMVDMYKKWLREEKNVSVPDSAGISIFENEKYQFTADSNYYDETREDFPWAPMHEY